VIFDLETFMEKANHVYTVELRLTGETLEVGGLSALLKLEPSNSSYGEGNTAQGARRHPYWAFNGHTFHGFRAEWLSLNDGLEFLVPQLIPFREQIRELSARYEGVWWCGHFQSSFDGGPTLSAALLGELAKYSLPLQIDNYFSNE
jgi:hypothetical protein